MWIFFGKVCSSCWNVGWYGNHDVIDECLFLDPRGKDGSIIWHEDARYFRILYTRFSAWHVGDVVEG